MYLRQSQKRTTEEKLVMCVEFDTGLTVRPQGKQKAQPHKPKFSAQERKEFRKQKRSQNRLLAVPVDCPNLKFDSIKKSTLESLCFEGGDEKDK